MNKSDISRVIELLGRVAQTAPAQHPLMNGKDLLERHAYDTVLSMAGVCGTASRAIAIVPGGSAVLAYVRDAAGEVVVFELAGQDDVPLLFPAAPVGFSGNGHQAWLNASALQNCAPAGQEAAAEFFIAAAPVHGVDGAPCGLLCTTATHAGTQGANQLQMIGLCAQQASQIMESMRRLDQERYAHAQMRNQLEQRDKQLQQALQEASSLRHEVGSLELLSDTDGLTGIKNRRAFDAAITDELEYAARRPHPVSMLMIDVDNFKKYNDTYGHVKGDEVLKTIALVMQCSLRSFEHVARYGGEEFAMILPNSTSVEARHVARRLQQAVEKYPWPDRPITISIGLATTSSRKTDTPASLIGCADAALYNAKANGRNRVECYA
ncbi:MAG: GGDEF domain-containing protein [Janthinobacterium lividum]